MKRAIIAGFGIGVAIGASFVVLGRGPDTNESHAITAQHAQTQPTSAPAKAQYDPLGPAGDKAPERSRFERMVDDIARANGGQISLGQMMALAEIEARLNGSGYEEPPMAHVRSPSGSVPTYGMTRSYSTLRESRTPTDYARSPLDYESASGAQMRSTLPPASSIGDSSGRASNSGAVNTRTGEYYAPAGPGLVNTRNGTYYARAGPNGYTDTRTGQYIAAHR